MTEAEKATETEKAYVHWLYKAAGAGSRGLLKKLERVWTAQEIYRMAREGVLPDSGNRPSGSRRRQTAVM